MKNFFDLKYFKEIKVLLILELILALLLIFLHYNVTPIPSLWNKNALIIAFFIVGLSIGADPKTYNNLGTIFGVGFFLYMVWWIIFTIPNLQ
jgi:apolipoprotein N-acyltransferase